MEALLAIHDASFGYGREPVLEGVELIALSSDAWLLWGEPAVLRGRAGTGIADRVDRIGDRVIARGNVDAELHQGGLELEVSSDLLEVEELAPTADGRYVTSLLAAGDVDVTYLAGEERTHVRGDLVDGLFHAVAEPDSGGDPLRREWTDGVLNSHGNSFAEITQEDGRYEIQSKIGEGGFGVVYKAQQRSTKQSVAIKVLLADRLSRQQDAEREEIRSGRRRRTAQDLGSQGEERSAGRRRTGDATREPEVTEDRRAVRAHDHVGRLQVTVDETSGVQVSERGGQARHDGAHLARVAVSGPAPQFLALDPGAGGEHAARRQGAAVERPGDVLPPVPKIRAKADETRRHD